MAPSNTLPTHGNVATMNLNPMILTNIQGSPYFKVNLFELKTYHEVIDEIYYKVNHLEPWERGSRKTAGQTGMCGGVRGVGAGGIVSSAFCLLYKLYTLKLTRKQLIGLLTHPDSPYIRGIGFMYIRYSQPPADFWEWFSEYLEDDEEIDVKAGGGHTMTIGELCRQYLTKLEWYSTLFPRIPVPVQKDLDVKLKAYDEERRQTRMTEIQQSGGGGAGADDAQFGQAERATRKRSDSPRRSSPSTHRSDDRHRRHQRSHSRSHQHRSHSADKRRRSQSRDRRRSKSRDKSRRHRSRSRDRHHRRHHRSSRSRDRHHRRSRSRDRQHNASSSSASSSRHHHRRSERRENSFERDLQRERDRQRKDRDRHH